MAGRSPTRGLGFEGWRNIEKGHHLLTGGVPDLSRDRGALFGGVKSEHGCCKAWSMSLHQGFIGDSRAYLRSHCVPCEARTISFNILDFFGCGLTPKIGIQALRFGNEPRAPTCKGLALTSTQKV